MTRKPSCATCCPRYEVPENAVPAIRIRLMLAQAYAGLDQRSQSTRVLTRGIEYAGMRDLKAQVQELRTTQGKARPHRQRAGGA